ncbi:hypothetical protein U1Q18_002386 [Sarracenia purpurea var. burkii]
MLFWDWNNRAILKALASMLTLGKGFGLPLILRWCLGRLGELGKCKFFLGILEMKSSLCASEVQISPKAMEMQKFIWNEILASLGISCSRKNRVSLCALDALTLLVFVNSVCRELSLG